LSPSARLAARIEAALPQTQCTRCGYPDCAAYAQAIVQEQVPINQCPPGGAEGIARLAQLTGQPLLALNPAHGQETARSVAVVDEAWCIGCTLCITACPTDAIVGSNKRMHTVITAHCTGCELCIPVCPVDCIQLENASGPLTGWNAWSDADASKALERYKLHSTRRSKDARQGMKTLTEEPTTPQTGTPPPQTCAEGAAPSSKQALIAAALARARAQRAQ
jgi:electron transport complex protein RnfB